MEKDMKVGSGSWYLPPLSALYYQLHIPARPFDATGFVVSFSVESCGLPPCPVTLPQVRHPSTWHLPG